MTRETTTYNIYTCDRCEIVMKRAPNDRKWGTINGQCDNGTKLLVDPDCFYKMADICPDCVASFQSWWKEVI